MESHFSLVVAGYAESECEKCNDVEGIYFSVVFLFY